MPRNVIVPPSARGRGLLEWLVSEGHFISAPCGGRGVCGKCRVRVIGGSVSDRDGHMVSASDGTVLACRAVCSEEGAEIIIPQSAVEGADATRSSGVVGTTSAASDGIALDIGTTTIACARVDARSGTIVASASRLNPQRAFGADVVSRIAACGNGRLDDMRTSLLREVGSLIAGLFPEIDGIPGYVVPSMAIAGNATMLHIFCGVSPEGMGRYPFLPAFRDARVVSGRELGLPVGKATLLPSVSAFVGGDITAGMLECGFSDETDAAPRLLVDIGTNGEMVVQARGRTVATSTAAGPALEGASISCGTGGVVGAVSRARFGGEPGSLEFETIGDGEPTGICGSGLVDLCARLLELGEIDGSGLVADGGYTLSGTWRRADGNRPGVVTPIRLTQKDVRELQLAKSAIRSGIETLLAAVGYTAESFAGAGGRVFVAGGLGFYLDPLCAITIGLLPREFYPLVRAMGNTALLGAARAIADASAVDVMGRLAASCEVIELNRSEKFGRAFVENMMFPE